MDYLNMSRSELITEINRLNECRDELQKQVSALKKRDKSSKTIKVGDALYHDLLTAVRAESLSVRDYYILKYHLYLYDSCLIKGKLFERAQI